jgi:hypothetical protein
MAQKRKQTKTTTHPTTSFQDTVAKAVNEKLNATLNEKIQQAAILITRNLNSSIKDVYTRLTVVEDIISDKLGISQDELALMVASVEDKAAGLTEVEEVELNDLVRLEIQTKRPTDTEFLEKTRSQVASVGSGATYGSELEAKILGMKKGEVKEFTYGQGETEINVKFHVQRISRDLRNKGA